MSADLAELPTLPSGPLRPKEASEHSDELARTALRVLSERRWWFVITTILVFGLSVLWLRRQKPIYRATGTLTVDANSPRVLGGDAEVGALGATGSLAVRAYYASQRQVLQSRDLAAMVVNRLGLARDERFLGLNNPAKPLTRAQKDAVIASADVVGMMAGRVLIDAPDDSGVVKVSVEDEDPDVAKELVNATLKAYRDRNIEVRKRVVKEASSDLNAIFKRLEGEKTASQQALYVYDRDHDFSDTRRTVVTERVQALSRALREVRLTKLRAGQEVAALKKARGLRDVFSGSAPALLRDGLVSELKRRHVELSAKRRELAATYLEAHPRVIAVDQQLEQLAGLANRHANAMYDAAVSQAAAAAAEEKDLETQLTAARAEDEEIRKAKIEHDRLQAAAEEDKLFYDKVAKRLTETDLARDIGVNNINILDLAVTPKSPVRPNVQLSVTLGFILALLAGAGAAAGVNLLDNTLKDRVDVEQYLGVSFLGSVPYFDPSNANEGLPVPLDRIDLYAHYRPQSPVAEAARAMRTNLLFMRPDRPPRSLLVTSAAPREGKTATSTTLAVTLGASTGKALLVDTDLRKPRLHRLFGLPGGEGGLTSHVLTNQPIENFIRKTDVPGLDLLPCGPLPPNPAELVHSERFRQLVKRLEELYDAVIFDSSPVQLVTDPLVVASMVDGVVVVAQSEVTRKDAAKAVVDALHAVKANVFGIVLSRTRRHAGRYGYYYTKGYRRGGAYAYRYAYRYQREPGADSEAASDDAKD
ncbi:MAG: polysaccharide biosynthesis tyrosine autokinase [Deltaproteobacteria bacterium]|nr:polysaccharide biosynthesis tyrosine autokinase [Deltaproteobacteria bacterium]